MNGHVDEQRAKDQQVGPVVDGVFYQSGFDFAGDGEASRASVRLHEGQQQPDNTQQEKQSVSSFTSSQRSDLNGALTM